MSPAPCGLLPRRGPSLSPPITFVTTLNENPKSTAVRDLARGEGHTGEVLGRLDIGRIV